MQKSPISDAGDGRYNVSPTSLEFSGRVVNHPTQPEIIWLLSPHLRGATESDDELSFYTPPHFLSLPVWSFIGLLTRIVSVSFLSGTGVGGVVVIDTATATDDLG